MPEPLGPFDPRPEGKPYYISPHCDGCGASLVLLDDLEPPEDGIIWYDEWLCPECRDAVNLDWSDEMYALLVEEVLTELVLKPSEETDDRT